MFALDDVCLAKDNQCSGAAYTDPLVDRGLLPDHTAALDAAIASTSPDGCFTPTQEAVHSVLLGATKRKQAFPDHVVVAVLVSDGGTCCQACPIEEPEGLGQIAASFLLGPPSIPTFAIFLDPKASKVMTSIATNGGTTKAFNGSGRPRAFADALKDIQAQSLPCQLHIADATLSPSPAPKSQFDLQIARSLRVPGRSLVPRCLPAKSCSYHAAAQSPAVEDAIGDVMFDLVRQAVSDASRHIERAVEWLRCRTSTCRATR